MRVLVSLSVMSLRKKWNQSSSARDLEVPQGTARRHCVAETFVFTSLHERWQNIREVAKHTFERSNQQDNGQSRLTSISQPWRVPQCISAATKTAPRIAKYRVRTKITLCVATQAALVTVENERSRAGSRRKSTIEPAFRSRGSVGSRRAQLAGFSQTSIFNLPSVVTMVRGCDNGTNFSLIDHTTGGTASTSVGSAPTQRGTGSSCERCPRSGEFGQLLPNDLYGWTKYRQLFVALLVGYPRRRSQPERIGPRRVRIPCQFPLFCVHTSSARSSSKTRGPRGKHRKL